MSDEVTPADNLRIFTKEVNKVSRRQRVAIGFGVSGTVGWLIAGLLFFGTGSDVRDVKAVQEGQAAQAHYQRENLDRALCASRIEADFEIAVGKALLRLDLGIPREEVVAELTDAQDALQRREEICPAPTPPDG